MIGTLVIDYGSGNLRSAAKALERAAAEAGRGGPVVVSSDAGAVARADRIVLPGVGAFADCRRGLDAVPGLVEALREAVLDAGRPILGICVGMQLLATTGREHGTHPGLGWIEGEVVPLNGRGRDGRPLKIPHMGWNELDIARPDHPVLTGIASGDHVYFVHSYHFAPSEPAAQLATVDYGGPVTAVAARGNLVGTQFHPEKSQGTGLRLLRNFLEWHP